MSDEMVESHVRKRVREGATPDQIRAELAGMGMDVTAANKLMAPPPKDEWAPILFWMQLSPLLIVPVVCLVMAAIYPKPQLAVMLVALGMATNIVAWFSMLGQCYSESNTFWVVMILLFGSLAMLCFFVWNITKVWKVFLIYSMGVVVIVSGIVLDPDAIADAFPDGLRIRTRRMRGELDMPPQPPVRAAAVDRALA